MGITSENAKDFEEMDAALDKLLEEDSVKDPYEDICEFWGSDMPLMCCEELGELTQAISKRERWWRKPDAAKHNALAKPQNDVIIEMADVYIAMRALCYKYKIKDSDIREAINVKLNRKYETR